MDRNSQVARVHQIVDQLEALGGEAAEASAYLREHRTRVGVHSQPTGARWTIRRRIELHPRFVATDADELYAISLIIHEVRHLHQGPLKALSVYGELEAWQLQFAFLKHVTGRYHPDPQREQILQRLMALPLGWDRTILQQARELMQIFGGKQYRVDLLPLYPLGREIEYRTLGRVPGTESTN